MAEIQVSGSTGADVNGLFTPLKVIISFLFDNWFFIVFGIIIAILVGLLIYFIFNWRDEKRKRDEPGFQKYKMVYDDCVKNRNPKKYKFGYSLINLFWFGFPIIKSDRSTRITNRYNNCIGRYRGHSYSQDGTVNYLVCVKRFLNLIDQNIILKIPLNVKYKEKDEKTKKLITKVFKINIITEDKFNNEININMIGIEKIGVFYSMPVMLDTNNNTVDFREIMEGVVTDNTYQLMVQRLLNAGAKMSEKAIELNPNLQYSQKSPEKTSQESDNEQE